MSSDPQTMPMSDEDDASAADSPTASSGDFVAMHGNTAVSAVAAATLWEIPVPLRVVLARTRMSIARLLALKEGDEIRLERRVGEPVDIYVHDRIIGRGELISVDDDTIGVSFIDIAKPR
ncbi:FliM/FliN family flagellar motor switch protein [Sandaracinobacteroides saxicola]|uniref:Flagellar motor switch protein FliN n=1 Tax=Sandaracinobacteroides saxicola TaxID=2759707 RepID=A0A7G5IJZ5_9SPHN|nr:FliM/FliN family flagellar motor switch protein [Sandaracinobacteroides saxicola]QMW23687.1 FliM/FliN family flagellar motor switch protein [Sandaracinobacteroides saxicola]